jgi:alginate O-acetyltransferase complex protein AlgJ
LISNAPLSTDLKSTSQLNQLEHALKLHARPNWENIVSVGVFVATIVFFTIAAALSATSNQASVLENENRKLAPFPGLHTVKKDLPKFAQGFEKFYNDRFAFRLPLVSSRNFILAKTLDSSGDVQVGIGRNNWLYYAVPEAISAQTNLEPFSDVDLQAWVQSFKARKNFLNQHGIKYVCVIPPEKGAIYPEYLPSRLSVHSGKTRLDQLQDYLRAHTDVDFIDAKALLLKAKSGQIPIYHKPDSHWNQYGSFVVTQELLKHIHTYFSAVVPLSPTDYQITTDYPFIGDLGKMLGLGLLFAERATCVYMTHEKGHTKADARVTPLPECWVPSFAWVHPDVSLPRVFVLRDSFSGYLIPFLAERASFSEFHWSHRLMAPLVLAQKPDIVVDEMAERHLYNFVPENAPLFSIDKSHSDVVLANFENTFELKNVVVRPSKAGIVVQLQWRSLKEKALNKHIALHLLPDSGVSLASREYDQDALGRTVPAFSAWTDTVEVRCSSRQKVSQLGINLHADDGTSMAAVAKKTDWGAARLLLSLKDLDKRNAH